MKNRVNYLAKEEQKFLKKIVKQRDEAEKRQQLKTERISHLRERIKVEKDVQDGIY